MLFYKPVQSNRYFSKNVKYSEIDWNDLSRVVEAFETRINDWYIRPAEALRSVSFDSAFALMAINCLLIDTLSQFYYGKNQSSRTLFKKFVKKHLPPFRQKLSTPIQIRPERRKRRKSGGSKLKPLKKKYYKTYADILYHCFRCGILHEAHISLCGGIAGLGGKMVDTDTDICTKYRNDSNCPTVRMDPTVIFDEVKKLFSQYIANLRDPDPQFDVRRKKFKKKFTDSIGVDLSTLL